MTFNSSIYVELTGGGGHASLIGFRDATDDCIVPARGSGGGGDAETTTAADRHYSSFLLGIAVAKAHKIHSNERMATIKFDMTPEDRANALAEAKARGLPSGWTVELDVSNRMLDRLACVPSGILAESLKSLFQLSETKTPQMDRSEWQNL